MPAPEPAGRPPPGAMPEEVLATLATLLAPGGRARLSPYVEATQFDVLFNEVPVQEDWVASTRMLLERKKRSLNKIASTWRWRWRQHLVEGEDPFNAAWYDDGHFLHAYLVRYFSVYVLKVQLALLALVRAGRLGGEVTVVDIGVGAGTTAVAMLDFVLAWNRACNQVGVRCPITGLRLFGVDRNQRCLAYARIVVAAYARAVGTALARRGPGPRDALARVHEWATAALAPDCWIEHDLDVGQPEGLPVPTIVAVVNVLNELDEQAIRNLDAYLAGIPCSATVLVIEPGTIALSAEFVDWRTALMARDGDFSVRQSKNRRSDTFHPSLLYKAFRAILRDNESGDGAQPSEDDRFWWSYALLQRAGTPPEASLVHQVQPAFPMSAGLAEPGTRDVVPSSGQPEAPQLVRPGKPEIVGDISFIPPLERYGLPVTAEEWHQAREWLQRLLGTAPTIHPELERIVEQFRHRINLPSVDPDRLHLYPVSGRDIVLHRPNNPNDRDIPIGFVITPTGHFGLR